MTHVTWHHGHEIIVSCYGEHSVTSDYGVSRGDVALPTLGLAH